MEERILRAHGIGGGMTQELIAKVFVEAFDDPTLRLLEDSAVLPVEASRLAFTTDSFVVSPLFFNGGDIGKLSVCGTVNDLAVMGAVPRCMSVSFILEEGLEIATLKRVVGSMAAAAKEAGVRIVAGDTKVVERGSGDGVFITTTGIGAVPAGLEISAANARLGDKVILNGPIGNHSIAVLSQREGLQFTSRIASDCAPLNGLAAAMLELGGGIHCMRDVTRGGLATVLNEIASSSGKGIILEEGRIPVDDDVFAACEMLGLDPLYMANEGKLVAIVAPEDADAVLAAMRKEPYGRDAAIIGSVVAGPAGQVRMNTTIAGQRIVNTHAGEELPRIC